MIDRETELRAMIVAEAKECVGTRFRHQASLKGVGMDCIGLISWVATAMGFPEGKAFRSDPSFRGYARQPDPALLKTALDKYLDRVSVPQIGDIVLMRFEKEPQHFGILSAKDYLIHAYQPSRKVVENRINDDWRSRIVSYHKFKEL